MKNNIFLFLILLLFLFTRLYKISSIPASVYWDEASIGYNAYSMLKTGKDEWGETLPLHFRAFGEFKLPVYIYSTIPFIYLFGLNEFSVRIPSVIYGLGVVLMLYLLTLIITKNRTASLFAAFFAVVTPWFFIFSRSGYEAVAGLFFFLLGLYGLLSLSFKKEIGMFTTLIRITVVTVVFVVSTYAYNSFRLLSPLVLATIPVINLRGNNLGLRKKAMLGLIPLLIFIFAYWPVYRLYRFDAGSSRAIAVSLTGNSMEKTQQFIKNYFSHFFYSFLFSNGDKNIRSQLPGFGQLYFISLPFILLGLWRAVKERNKYWLVLLLVLISPIPASITKESPHALRSITMLPFFAIIFAKSIEFLLDIFPRYKSYLIIGVTGLFIMYFAAYFRSFLLNYNRISSENWQYGYKEVFMRYANNFKKYDRVIVSDYLAQPYIFALFYQSYDPGVFLNEVRYNPVNDWGFSTVESFANFEFKKVDESDFKKGSLIFASPAVARMDIKESAIINNLDGSVAFYVDEK